MTLWGGANEALLTELITANKPPPRQPGPIGLRDPCRRPSDGLRDLTLPSPAAARRAEVRRVLAYVAAVAVGFLTGLAVMR